MVTIIFLANTAAGSSIIAVYNDSNDILSGKQVPPDQLVQVTTPGADITWEGQPITATLSGRNFTFHVNAGAFGQPHEAQVGTGNHVIASTSPPPPGEQAFERWNIYRDDGRVIYTDPNLGAVQTLYFCLDVSTSILT